ncbi:hypothetical protein NSA19_12405 [Actinomyces bowdenii]|uniref:DUF6571 family protein n=1 Tax=Actinomyces bowdenii TaxID=131109 RepID=UPI00214AA158|nr:hypothetical protein [Actinomyces bowdenii]
MAFIQIDTNGMLTVINNLTERAAAINAQRKNISDSSAENHDPVASVVDATTAYPGFLTPGPGSGTLSGCANGLLSLADELRTRRQEAIDLNSSGITTSDTSGVVSYYLPDPPEGTVDTEAYWNSMDTVANVKSYNSESVKNAQAESAELAEALENGKSSKGRTAEEIIAEINKHRDIPTYSVAFCTKMGVDNMLDAPLNAQEDTNYAIAEQPPIIPQLVETFGHIMSSASTLHNENAEAQRFTTPGSPTPFSLHDALYSAVTEKGHEGRATVMDAYLTAEGTVYDTEFLVDLGESMEKIEDWPAEPRGVSWTTNHGNDDYSNKYLPGHTTDPLAAVLHAMGNNPEAANAYLAPEDSNSTDNSWAPSQKAKERMEMLSSRGWTDLSLRGLSAVYAAASAERAPDPGNDRDERASWATTQGISILNDQNIPASGETTRNVGVMLANCGPEVTTIASDAGDITKPDSYYQTTPLAVDGPGGEAEVRQDIAQLLYKTSLDAHATHAIAQGVTVYADNRAKSRVADPTDAESASEVTASYQDAEKVLSLMNALAEDRTNTSKNNGDQAVAGVSAATTLLSAVPGSAPITIPASILTTAAGAASDPQPTGLNSSVALQAAAYTTAIQSGLVTTPPENAPWYDSNTQQINLDSKEAVEGFNAWVKDGAGNSSDLKTGFDSLGTDVDDYWYEKTDPKLASGKNAESFKKITESSE